MKTLIALLQREYWEHRGAFLKTPLIIGTIFVVILILAYISTARFDLLISSGEAIELGAKSLGDIDSNTITGILDIFMLSTAYFYHIVMFIVIFFFLLGSLHDDRKDGSILFWKSLPVSDTQTVISKLVTAMVVVPLLFTACLIISHLVFFLVLSLILLLNAINPFTILWANIDYIFNWSAYLVGCFVQFMWALPIYGWLLFASAYSKRRPFLLAVFVPLSAGFIWYWYNVLVNYNVFKTGVFETIGILMAKAFSPFTSGLSFDLESIDFDARNQSNIDLIKSMLSGLSNSSIYYGLVFAVILIGLAIYVRRFRNTT